MDTPFPILEFDPDRIAILEPTPVDIEGPAPDRLVMCFFQDVLAKWVEDGRLTAVGVIRSELGVHPIYRMEVDGEQLFVLHAGLGAPLSAGLLEEMIALGVKRVMVAGGCGVLEKEIVTGHPVILTSAVRDEGTSYHYLPPAREVGPHPDAVAALEGVCKTGGVDYRLGKTWTTDAYYRETIARRALRLAEGCCVVEMEAAALFAVAQFRGISLGQIVYGGDLVVPEGWDSREWPNHRSARGLLFDLAVQACLRL